MNKGNMTLKEINDRHGILNKQLSAVIEVAAAVEMLLDQNFDPNRPHWFETVQAAAKVLANTNLAELGEGSSGQMAKTDEESNEILKNAGTSNVRLSEILQALDTRERRIRFDRDELLEMEAELYQCNRIDTIRWLKDEISNAEKEMQSAEGCENIEQWTAAEARFKAHKATLEQLANVKNLRMNAP